MSTDTDGATAAVADADASASTASNGDATGPQQQQQQPSSAPQPRPLGEDGKSVQWMDRVGQEIATVIEFENSDDEGPEGEPPRKAPSCSCTIC
mmetsp:Transcript_8617/g.31803  ORF Transcript_8617/g.31803 Transcript_8617/m.31803 type:complete len:94 (-) Transcript_8617:2228-2509(-)